MPATHTGTSNTKIATSGALSRNSSMFLCVWFVCNLFVLFLFWIQCLLVLIWSELTSALMFVLGFPVIWLHAFFSCFVFWISLILSTSVASCWSFILVIVQRRQLHYRGGWPRAVRTLAGPGCAGVCCVSACICVCMLSFCWFFCP